MARQKRQQGQVATWIDVLPPGGLDVLNDLPGFRMRDFAQQHQRHIRLLHYQLSEEGGEGVLALRGGGPSVPAPVTAERWDFNQEQGKVLKSPHYLIHTTISDPEVLERLPQVLEGAYAQYQSFCENPQPNKPMRCYVFAKRSEWAEFTARHTGMDASIYLQITRGGYTIGDWFVSYYVGDWTI